MFQLVLIKIISNLNIYPCQHWFHFEYVPMSTIQTWLTSKINSNTTINLFQVKINLSVFMCVLFYSSFVCISAYTNVYFKTTIIKPNIKTMLIQDNIHMSTVHCGNTVRFGRALPGYPTTAHHLYAFLHRAVLGGLAVWRHNNPKPQTWTIKAGRAGGVAA